MLADLASHLDEEVDVLMGKPMPIKTATYFYTNYKQDASRFDSYKQVQWLVDSEKRIQEYIELAKSLRQKLRLNLEIDVGLHRGGFGNIDQLKRGLELISQNKNLVTFSGLMGYDAHVTKLPAVVRSKK